MDIDESYVAVRKLIHEQELFAIDLIKKLTPRVLVRMYKVSPWEIARVYSLFFNSYRNDHVSYVDGRLEDYFRDAYEELFPLEERNEEAYSVAYASRNYTFSFAHLILKKLPGTDFDGLLAIHDFRKTEFAVLKDKKLLASAGTAVFALFQRSEIKVSEGLIIKLPYADIPAEIYQLFWVTLAILSLSFFGYYFFLFRRRVGIQQRIREILLAGKIIADSRLRQKRPNHPLNGTAFNGR